MRSGPLSFIIFKSSNSCTLKMEELTSCRHMVFNSTLGAAGLESREMLLVNLFADRHG